MSSTAKEIIQTFDELEKKHGNNPKFKQFKKKLSYDIDFIRFTAENNLKHNQKNGWNKPFIPTIKRIWIKKDKSGYYENIEAGWKLVRDEYDTKCRWCGKILQNPRAKCCSDNDGQHRKQYNKILKRGKEICGFDITKNHHILIIPKLWTYDFTETGSLIPTRTDIERIEYKDIVFSIKGKRYPLTKKGGKPRPKKTKSRTV